MGFSLFQPPEGEHVTIPESTNDPLSDRSHTSLEQVACSSSANVKPPKLLSIGRVIERRWHCLWLKSLEWQCFLEQLTWTPRLRKKVSKYFDFQPNSYISICRYETYI